MKKNLMIMLAALLPSGMVLAQEGTSVTEAVVSAYNSPGRTQLLRLIEELKNYQATAPYNVCATLNGDACSGLGVAWFTDAASDNASPAAGELQIVAKGEATASDFASGSTGLLTFTATTETASLPYSQTANKLQGIASGENRSYVSHKALATGLTPGTTYSYRVGTDGAWSDIGTFRTAKSDFGSEGFEFVYVTDTQAQTDEMFAVSQRTLHAAQAMVPEAQFVLVNGDLVETSKSQNAEWEYEQWFETMQDVWLQTPLMPLQGNHDTSSNHNWSLHFNTDRSFAETDMSGTVYSVVVGPALILAINLEDYKTAGYLDKLATWMRQEVAKVQNNPAVKWRIATYHKTLFTGSSSHQSDADGKTVRETLFPVFRELGINLALQGHDHIYEVIGPVQAAEGEAPYALAAGSVEKRESVEGNKRENMTGELGGTYHTGSGTLFFLNNSAGKKKYEPRTAAEMTAALTDHGVNNYWGLFSGRFGQTGEPTFSRVKVTDDVIEISTYTVDDAGRAVLFDRFSVDRQEPSSANKALATNSDKRLDISDNGRLARCPLATLTLHDTTGRIVAQAQNQLTIDAAPGLYVVTAALASGDILAQKIRVK